MIAPENLPANSFISSMELALRYLRDSVADVGAAVAHPERVLSDADDAPDRDHDKQTDEAGYHNFFACLMGADVLDKAPEEDNQRQRYEHRDNAVKDVARKRNELCKIVHKM